MKTKFEEIVNVASIGKAENPILMNELLKMASAEQLTPASDNLEKVLVLGIDVQQDFMDNGALGVPGAHGDVERFTRFIYDNMDYISQIAVSIDTHNPYQIFHPAWWVDENGNNPAPFTAITIADLDSGKWRAVINPIKSREYVAELEKMGKKVLVIWTYHCLQGTSGCALENQFANMIYFYSVAKKSLIMRLVKGQEIGSEMYGIIKPEYDYQQNYINIDFLNKAEKFDKIIIGGEAKSHCVLESIQQMLEHYANRPEVTKKFYILEDCMSNIPGFEQASEDAFARFKSQYKVNIVKSTDLVLKK
jgi:nicotinamidase-related amidase